MRAMAFFAFLPISEIAVSKQDSVNGNLLQLDQVSRKHSGKGNVVSLIITFKSYKHNYNQNPFSIVLNRQPKACPVQSFLDYVCVRGTVHGPLFINHNGSPVLRSGFSKCLAQLFGYATWIPIDIKDTALELVLLLMQLNKAFLTPRLGTWVNGNLMLSKSISE